MGARKRHPLSVGQPELPFPAPTGPTQAAPATEAPTHERPPAEAAGANVAAAHGMSEMLTAVLRCPAAFLASLPYPPTLQLDVGLRARAMHDGAPREAWVCLTSADYRAVRAYARSLPPTQPIAVLGGDEWAALLQGAAAERGTPLVGQWLGVKARSPHIPITERITLSGVQPVEVSLRLTTADALRAWDLSLRGVWCDPESGLHTVLA